MSHEIGMPQAPAVAPNRAGPNGAGLAGFQRLLAGLYWLLEYFNRLMVFLSMIALMATAIILTYSVMVRYFLHYPTDWQDEASVFMLVGVVFLCSAYVQALRGHIGIEALTGLLPPMVNRARLILVDLASCLFCAFFAWKSWTLFHEAWADGYTTSSTFAPPLWIPYAMMALGMSMLALQLLAQLLTRITGGITGDKDKAA